MSAQNLAIIFTPGLMPLSELTAYNSVAVHNHVKIITLLIENSVRIGELNDQIQREADGKIQQKVAVPTEAVSRGRSHDKEKTKKRRSGSLTRKFKTILV